MAYLLAMASSVVRASTDVRSFVTRYERKHRTTKHRSNTSLVEINKKKKKEDNLKVEQFSKIKFQIAKSTAISSKIIITQSDFYYDQDSVHSKHSANVSILGNKAS